MNIELKKSCGKSMYLQLYEAIVSEICDGRIQSGDFLPSRRTLSQKLDIAQTTVDNAYKMLQDTGYITSIPRQGYVVSFKTSDFNSDIPWEIKPSQQYVFSPNGIDYSQINRGMYAKLAKDILYNDGIDIFSYIEKGGEFVLRNVISKYLYSFMDIKCSPWQIILGAGTEYLLTSISFLFDDNTKYIIENPCEPHYYHSLHTYNRKIINLPLNIGKFDIDALYKSEGDILFIDSSGRFPRASALSEDDMQKILEWANSSPNRYIIENGYEAELNYAKKTLYSIDIHNKVIYLGSFVRTLSPAIKTSYIVLPDELLSAWKKKHTYYYSLISKQDQYTLAEFINKGYYVKHYKQIRKLYKEKKDYLKECLITEFGDKIKISENYGSTYIIVEVDIPNLEEYISTVRNRGIKIFSMNSYNQHKETEFIKHDKLVLGIGDLNRSQILKGVKLMSSCYFELSQ